MLKKWRGITLQAFSNRVGYHSFILGRCHFVFGRKRLLELEIRVREMIHVFGHKRLDRLEITTPCRQEFGEYARRRLLERERASGHESKPVGSFTIDAPDVR